MRLEGGPYVIQLAPEAGGAVSGLWFAFDGAERAILRPAPGGSTDPTSMGCFPLVPFCNRLRDGRFRFRGRTIKLAPNRPGEDHPLHGQAWLAPWSAVKLGPHRAEIQFEHLPGEWPWRYRAVQTIALSREGVAFSLEVRNLDDQPMPTGLGLHPYFPADSEVSIRTEVSGVLLTDPHRLADGRLAPAKGDHDLSDRRIAGAGLDHGFADWSGSLEIRRPDLTVRMTAADARWLQVYAPPGEDFFCAEPVTHANDALARDEDQWAGLGVKILEPGQAMRLDMRLEALAPVPPDR